MRGLPFSASVYDIEQFFAGYAIVPGTVRMGANADGRPR